MTVRLNVRCCCQPQKILGTLEVYSYARFQTISLMRLEPLSRMESPAETLTHAHRIESVQIREFIHAGGEKAEYAVYSDDHPVEYWRQFPTFIENTEGQ